MVFGVVQCVLSLALFALLAVVIWSAVHLAGKPEANSTTTDEPQRNLRREPDIVQLRLFDEIEPSTVKEENFIEKTDSSGFWTYLNGTVAIPTGAPPIVAPPISAPPISAPLTSALPTSAPTTKTTVPGATTDASIAQIQAPNTQLQVPIATQKSPPNRLPTMNIKVPIMSLDIRANLLPPVVPGGSGIKELGPNIVPRPHLSDPNIPKGSLRERKSLENKQENNESAVITSDLFMN